ncbi:MAG: ribosomal protein S18-alanine N-acetyltransferase [Chakrabartia sp.]
MTAVLHLKRGGVEDLSVVMPVMVAGFDSHFGEAWNETQCVGMLSLPNTALHLAYCGEDIAGFSMSRFVVDETELLLLAVKPQFQKMGIGSALLDQAAKWSHGCGAQRIFLEVREDNSAINLYHKAGFAVIGRRPRYYKGRDGDCRDAITYALNLFV